MLITIFYHSHSVRGGLEQEKVLDSIETNPPLQNGITAESREDSHNRDQIVNQQFIRNQNGSILIRLPRKENTTDDEFL